MKLHLYLLASAAAVLLNPAAGLACAVCVFPDPRTAGTYLGMTLMMSVLPLGLVGGLVYWLRRRYSRGSDTPAVRLSPRLKAAHSPRLLQ